MNRALQYAKYLFSHHKKTIFLYTLICFISYPLIVMFNLNNDVNSLGMIAQMGFIIYFVYLIILCIIMPSVSFRFINSKKSMDTYATLPITKRDMFVVHYLVPMLGICIPLILNFILGTIMMVAFSDYTFMNLVNFTFVMITTMKLMMVAYALNTFLVIRSNSFIDGILVSLGMSALPYLVFLVANSFANSQLVNTGMYAGEYFIPILNLFSPIWIAGANISESIVYNMGYCDYSYAFSWWHIYQLGVFCFLTFFAYQSFKVHKSEDAEQITTNFFTYPLLLAVAGIALVSLVDFTNYDLLTSLFLASITFVVFLILNLIARRTMKFSWKIIVKYVVLLVLFNGVAFVSHQTEFFGINRRLVDLKEVKRIEVNVSCSDDEKRSEGEISIDLEDGISASEQKFIDELQQLQILASTQHKENRYGWDSIYPQEDMVNIYIRYVSEYETITTQQIKAVRYEGRHYRFDKNDIKKITDRIEMKVEKFEDTKLVD